MTDKKVTFQDIANYTGFSKTTISRYFNRPDSLTEENRRKIASALEELDYKENKVAQILARGKTEYIGLIVPHMFMSFFSNILDRFLQTYGTYDYKFIVFSGGADPESERQYIKELLRYQVEGLIILSHMLTSEELASYETPLVSIEREDRCISSVNTDNHTGGVMAAELLMDNQCDVFIYVCSDSRQEVPSYHRFTGFRDTCEKNSKPYEYFFWDSVLYYNSMCELMHHVQGEIRDKYKGKRKGIFCSNDALARILLNSLFREYGYLPDDYRIVGFDNSPDSQQAVLPISSVGQQTDLLVKESMEILICQIRQRKDLKQSKPPIEHRQVPPTLVIRETSMPET